jgi:rod shape-determining protein MreB
VEKKAVCDAAKNAGAREVFLIEQPMAAAIGSRLPVQEAGGNFVVDIGGGTCEVAVISLGGIVLSKSLKIAGDRLNQDIIDYAESEYKLLLGERTAEDIKIAIGSAYPLKDKLQVPMRGRNLVTGFPEEIIVDNDDIRHALEKSVKQIVNAVKTAVEETPPELLADIMARGIYLSGGGSMLRGLDTLLTKETKIQTKVVDDPLTAVVRGAGMVIENLDALHEVLVGTDYLEPPR